MSESPDMDMEQVTREMGEAHEAVANEVIRDQKEAGEKDETGGLPSYLSPPAEYRQRIAVSEEEAIERIREGLKKVEEAEAPTSRGRLLRRIRPKRQ